MYVYYVRLNPKLEIQTRNEKQATTAQVASSDW
jgi:hypothetical protein